MKHLRDMNKRLLFLSILITAIFVLSCSKEGADVLSGQNTAFTVDRFSTRSLEEPLTQNSMAGTNNKWAIIINGGGDLYNNDIRYWNNCSFFYKTLKNVYGLPDNHIFVAMSDGLDHDFDRWNRFAGYYDDSPWDLDDNGTTDIDFPGTYAGIHDAFQAVADSDNGAQPGDEVIILITDHGDLSNSGQSYLVLWGGGQMTATQFRQELVSIPSSVTKHIVMGQCYSGGFIPWLQDVKQMTIATACSASQESFPTSGLQYDEFLYHWISAVAGQTPNGTPVNADSNSDGCISATEAFNYAYSNDSVPKDIECPQFYEYKGLFGRIPLFYEYNYIEPFLTGPEELYRGQSYTFHMRNWNPDLNAATLIPNNDFTLVSSSDSTIVISVNSTGDTKPTVISFGITSSDPLYLNGVFSCNVNIWAPGTSVDNYGIIQTVVDPFSLSCSAYLTGSYGLLGSSYMWKTMDANWNIVRKLLPEATYRCTSPVFPNQLSLSVDISNPFGTTTTLTKTIDLN